MKQHSPSTPDHALPQGEVELLRQLGDLQQQLADRDRRLGQLTEQSLLLLDELSEMRAEQRKDGLLEAQITSLQEQLADTRRRNRASARIKLGSELYQGSVDVVLWGLHSGVRPWVELLRKSLPVAPMVALVGSEELAEELRGIEDPRLALQDTECRTLSRAINDAMAMTQADVVVFVTAGCVAGAGALQTLASAAAPDGVAVASPCLLHDGRKFVGRMEVGLLDQHPVELREGQSSVLVPYASPEVFAISRAAFDALGVFDEDVVGDLALVEWGMRASAQGMRSVGVAASQWNTEALRREDAYAPAVESDRLVLLSRHRPQQLAAGAMGARSLWMQEPLALANVLRSVFRRLPHANELPAAVDLLTLQAQTVAGWKRMAPALRDRLVAAAQGLGIQVAQGLGDSALVGLAEEITAAVARMRQGQARLEECEGEIARLDEQNRDITAQAAARHEAIEALRRDLGERDATIAALRDELAQRTTERDRSHDGVEALQQQLEEQSTINQALTAQAERDAADLRAVLGEVDELRSGQEVLIKERAVAEARLMELADQLAAAQTAERESVAECRELAVALAEGRADAERLRVANEQVAAKLAEMTATAEEIQRQLGERDRWLVALLVEVQQPRWRRRQLTDQELEILTRIQQRS